MKGLVKVSALMMAVALVLTGCNCIKKVEKVTDNVSVTCNPTMLARVGDNVPAEVTVKVGPELFIKKGIVKITPVLVSSTGKELVGTPKYFQGEKVKDNYEVVNYKSGGQSTFTVNFPYNEDFKLSTLELRAEGKCKAKDEFEVLTVMPIARGITSVQDNADFVADMVMLEDNFKKVNTVTQQAEVMYLINRSDVRKNQVTSADVKALEEFVKKYSKEENATLNAVQSKGYASPDGPVEFNDQLSKKRGETAKAAVAPKLLSTAKYDISSYGEDWDGFQSMVQKSNIADKDLILQVLKMYSSPVQRDQEIHNMSAAFKVLATDILPKLRRAVMVGSADVKSKSDQELMAIAVANPADLTIEEALYIAPMLKDQNARLKVYEVAANKYGDARAYNNLAVEQARAGQLNKAAASLKIAASKGTDSRITDNIGMLALQTGDLKVAKDALSKSSNPEAKAALAFANGDYSAASKGLKGYNLAVAQLANNNVSGAKATLASVPSTADSDYLKAVVAARQGDSKAAIANLKSAIAKDPSMKAKAQTDAEFYVLFDDPIFLAI